MNEKPAIEGISNGVKGLFILNGIPNFSVPEWLKSAVEQAEFVAVCDIMENDLTRRAEIVIPGATFVEKDGTFVNCDGRLQRIRKCVNAFYPVQAEVELSTHNPSLVTYHSPLSTLQEILIELNVREQVLSAEGVFKEMARELPAFSGLDYGKIGEQGMVIKG